MNIFNEFGGAGFENIVYLYPYLCDGNLVYLGKKSKLWRKKKVLEMPMVLSLPDYVMK